MASSNDISGSKMSQRPLPPNDEEDQFLVSKKQKRSNASPGPKNNEIGLAGASQHRALSPSTSGPQGAGHGLPELAGGLNTQCPYHTHILQEPLSYRVRETLSTTMERFMIHHPGEQYALFNRPDNENISIYRECTCRLVIGNNPSSTETKPMLVGEEVELSGFQFGL
ncbi:hypothetical protein V8E54_011129 [Elaphomyces granulatus]